MIPHLSDPSVVVARMAEKFKVDGVLLYRHWNEAYVIVIRERCRSNAEHGGVQMLNA
jgi:hypothetical protein